MNITLKNSQKTCNHLQNNIRYHKIIYYTLVKARASSYSDLIKGH